MRITICMVPIVAASVILVASQAATAGEDKKGKSPELTELNLTGTVTSEQIEKKKKDGQAVTITVYYLKTEDGNIHLPEPQPSKKGEPAPLKLADYVGAKVELVAQGFSKPSKEGEKRVFVKRIVRIKRIEV